MIFGFHNHNTWLLCFLEEIKICGTTKDDCSEFATCADTGLGSYTCTCNEGYTGDGKTCEGNIYLFTAKTIICK